MPVSPPVTKTTWVFIEFLLETLHSQFLGLLIEQTITFAVAPSSILRTKDHQVPCSPMGNAYCSCDSDSLGAANHPSTPNRNRACKRSHHHAVLRLHGSDMSC